MQASKGLASGRTYGQQYEADGELRVLSDGRVEGLGSGRVPDV